MSFLEEVQNNVNTYNKSIQQQEQNSINQVFISMEIHRIYQ